MRERTDAGRGRTAAFILLFLVLGALLGTRMVWTVALTSLLLASLCGILLMIFRRAERKTRLPFLFFTGLALAGDMLLCLGKIQW